MELTGYILYYLIPVYIMWPIFLAKSSHNYPDEIDEDNDEIEDRSEGCFRWD